MRRIASPNSPARCRRSQTRVGALRLVESFPTLTGKMNGSALAGKALVVIGGTTGLGLSAARAFVENGARVVVVGRDAENVKKAQRILGKACRALAGDAREPET